MKVDLPFDRGKAGLAMLASIATNRNDSCQHITTIHAKQKDRELPECIKNLRAAAELPTTDVPIALALAERIIKLISKLGDEESTSVPSSALFFFLQKPWKGRALSNTKIMPSILNGAIKTIDFILWGNGIKIFGPLRAILGKYFGVVLGVLSGVLFGKTGNIWTNIGGLFAILASFYLLSQGWTRTAHSPFSFSVVIDQLQKMVEVEIPQLSFEEQGWRPYGAQLLPIHANMKLLREGICYVIGLLRKSSCCRNNRGDAAKIEQLLPGELWLRARSCEMRLATCKFGPSGGWFDDGEIDQCKSDGATRHRAILIGSKVRRHYEDDVHSITSESSLFPFDRGKRQSTIASDGRGPDVGHYPHYIGRLLSHPRGRGYLQRRGNVRIPNGGTLASYDGGVVARMGDEAEDAVRKVKAEEIVRCCKGPIFWAGLTRDGVG